MQKRANKLKIKSEIVITVSNQTLELNSSILEQANKEQENVILLNQSPMIEAIINALQSFSQRSINQIDSIANAAINGDFQSLAQICRILNKYFN